MRWKAERWIKARHWWTLFKHDPWFMARNIKGIADFNFRGSTVKTFLGLEDERVAFARYRGMRAAERSYV
jgi:anaerobic magnesium-protoporphyrin IX monomethyl ester cyclase